MKIIFICHESLVPPEGFKSDACAEHKPWRTEYFVKNALVQIGHNVKFCGLSDELEPLRECIRTFKPDFAFVMLEEFRGESLLESFVVSYLEKLKVPFSGCSPTGLILAKNKYAAKKIMQENGVPVPDENRFPRIVKYMSEESSFGISDSSIVENETKLRKRVQFLKKKLHGKIFSEAYIPGREVHVAVMPIDGRLRAFTPLETVFGNKTGPALLTSRMKWNFRLRDRLGVKIRRLKAPKTVLDAIENTSLLACRSLNIDGPARVDIRLSEDGIPYVLEVNPNPDLSKWDEYATSAKKSGLTYHQLIAKIVEQGLAR